jgi:hypothetical protein
LLLKVCQKKSFTGSASYTKNRQTNRKNDRQKRGAGIKTTKEFRAKRISHHQEEKIKYNTTARKSSKGKTGRRSSAWSPFPVHQSLISFTGFFMFTF